jgi:diguanylate cyclase (GGDEF)-like protein/PAS domain S-box-containing protein
MPSFKLGLRWKLMLPMSLLIGCIIGIFTWQSDRTLRSQYDSIRTDAASRNAELLAFLVARNAEDYLDLATNLPARLDLHDIDQLRQADTLKARLTPYFESLAMGRNIEGVVLFGTDQRPYLQMGQIDYQQDALKLALSSVLRNEKPYSQVLCWQSCQLYVIAPLLLEGNTAGAIMLSSSLARIIAGFSENSAANLLLTVSDKAVTPGRLLPSLSVKLVASSGRVLQNEIYDKLLAAGPNLRDSLLLSDSKGHILEFRALPLTSESPQTPRYFTLNDVTRSQTAIQSALNNNLLTGFLSLVAAVILLYGFMAWSMQRLSRVTRALPLLGDGRWSLAQTQLKETSGRIEDEVTDLQRVALKLAAQLESYGVETARQQQELSRLVDELSRERDFVAGLLDSAAMLIVTQDRDGKLRMLNAYTQQTTGMSYSRLLGQPFFDTFAPQELAEALQADLFARLAEGEPLIRQEFELSTPDGKREIAWVHTRIGISTSEQAQILSIGTDLTELHRANRRAAFLSDFDPLTGLMNRRAFETALGKQLQSSVDGTLLIFDLDDFKTLNDLVGHASGDAVLRQVAKFIDNLDPAPELAARVGGDDFALYFEQLTTVQALQTARLISRGGEGGKDLSGHRNQVTTACVGIARYPQHATDSASLMAVADLALSQAREKGRANWHVYTPSDQVRETLLDRAQRLNILSEALEQQRLELFLQPIMRLSNGLISHYEVLLRIRDRSGNLLSPALFIQTAEETGLIRDIDEWVLRAAIATLGMCKNKLHFSINLSARSLDNPALLSVMQSALKVHEVDARQLMFEITETAALSNLERASMVLSQIRELGAQIALDDFGVGFSTFQYLKHLPVDFVKIDGSFIRNLDKNEDDRVFVRALLEAVHGFGKLAIAEFVENEVILTQIQNLGLDYAQGYHIGRPVPVSDVVRQAKQQGRVAS